MVGTGIGTFHLRSLCQESVSADQTRRRMDHLAHGQIRTGFLPQISLKQGTKATPPDSQYEDDICIFYYCAFLYLRLSEG